MSKRRCIIMIGPVGAGKTTYAKHLCETEGLVYLSPDDCWDRAKVKEYSEEICIEAWGEIYGKIFKCIKRGQDFLVDTAQHNGRSRRELTGIIRSMSHGEYKITGIHLKRDLAACLASARDREDSVPEEKIREYFELLQQEPPDPSDGYDEIIEVDGDVESERLGNAGR